MPRPIGSPQGGFPDIPSPSANPVDQETGNAEAGISQRSILPRRNATPSTNLSIPPGPASSSIQRPGTPIGDYRKSQQDYEQFCDDLFDLYDRVSDAYSEEIEELRGEHSETSSQSSRTPAIDPDSQTITGSFSGVIQGLKDHLPNINLSQRDKEKMESSLGQLSTKLDDIIASNPSGNRHSDIKGNLQTATSIRTKFREASAIADNLSKQVSNPQLKQGFQHLSLLFNELKRTHFSSGQPHHILLIAGKLAELMDRKSPGASAQRSGNAIIQSGSTAVGASYGFDDVLKVFGSIGYGALDTHQIDDDGGMNIWRMWEFLANIGIEGAPDPFRFGVHGQLNTGRGSTYFASDDNKEAFKMWLNHLIQKQNKGGPFMQAIRATLDKLSQLFTKLTVGSDRLDDTLSIPAYTLPKLEKGAYNRLTLHELAQKVDEAFSDYTETGETSLRQIFEKRYPSLTSQAQHSPDTSANSITALAPIAIPAPATKWSSRTQNVDVDSGKVKIRPDTNFSTTLSINANGRITTPKVPVVDITADIGLEGQLSGTYRGFNLERVHEAASHQRLDPSINMDIRETFRLMEGLNQYYGKEVADKHSTPRLYLAQEASKAVADAGPRIKTSKNQVDLSYYGSNTSINPHIPVDILDTIDYPCPEKLTAIASQCLELAKAYDHFLEDAEKARISPESISYKELEETARSLANMRNQGIWNICEHVFGRNMEIKPLSSQESKEFIQNPQELVARGYDAFSLALGHLGAHLFVINREFGKEAQKQQLPQTTIDMLEKANHAYRTLRQRLDAANVPLDLESLQRRSTLASFGGTRQLRVTSAGSIGGGPQLNVLSPVLNTPIALANPALSAESGAQPNTFNAQLESGSTSLNMQHTYTNVLDHGNQGRRGIYHDFRITIDQPFLESNRLTEKSITFLSTSILARMFPEAKGLNKISLKERVSMLDAIKQPLRGLILGDTQGNAVEIRYHRFPNDADDSSIKFDTRLAYARQLATSDQIIDLEANVPVHPGVNVTIETQLTRNAQAGQNEIMGSDVNYHVMQFSKLRDLVKEDGVDKSREDAENALNADPYVKHQFFGSDGIAQILSDYSQWRQNPTDVSRQQTGFDYYHTERFEMKSGRARESVHYAPGKTSAELFTPPPPALTAGYPLASDQAHALDTLLPALSSCNSADTRQSFLLGEGRELLNTYLGIMGHYNEINAVAYQGLGYVADIRDPKGRVSADS